MADVKHSRYMEVILELQDDIYFISMIVIIVIIADTHNLGIILHTIKLVYNHHNI